ncbi:MAG TPA: hypothetical protein VN895_02000, partial [Candidatus Acidoferrum sp.]|nr:hypothetical protein [Candidatus Acidoferrum sp.]
GGVTAVETTASGAAAAGNAGTGVLANTGGGPLAAETVLGSLLALIGALLLKPRQLLRRFTR